MADLRYLPSRRGRHFFRLNLALAAASLAGCGADPPPSSPPAVLEPAAGCAATGDWQLVPGFVQEGLVAAEGDLAKSSDGSHCGYRFRLEDGQALELEIGQRGKDLLVEVWDGAGRQVLWVDTPIGDHGFEPVFLVATGPSELLLRASPWEKVSAPAIFSVTVKSLRPATASDRKLAEAWRELSAGQLVRHSSVLAPDEAKRRFGRAIDLFRQTGHLALAARAAFDLGRTYSKDPATRSAASAAFDRSISLADAAGDPGELSRALYASGALSLEQGNFEKAQPAFEKLLALRRSSGTSAEQAATLSDLAEVLQRRGAYPSAIDHFMEALSLWRQLKLPVNEATTRTNLGSVYMNVGNRRQAAVHFRGALQLLEGLPFSAQRGLALSRLGDAELFLAGPATALPRYAEALSIFRKLENVELQALVFNSIGLAERQAQRPRQALEALQQALAIYRQAGSLSKASTVAANLASCYEDLGEGKRAEEEFERALLWAREAGVDSTEVDALEGLGRAARARGDRSEAILFLAEALELLERHRLRPAQSDHRSSFLDMRLDPYEMMVDLLIEKAEPGSGDLDKAFEIAERSRIRGVLAPLRRAAGSPAADVIDRDLESASEEIKALHGHRLEEGSGLEAPGQPNQAGDALTLAFERYQQIEARLFRLDDTPPAVPTLASVRQDLLDPGTLLLAYYVAPERSFLWSIDTDRVQLHRLPAKAQLESLARDLFARLGRQTDPLQRPALEVALAEASRLLLEPVAAELAEAERVMIVPSAFLRSLPFGALPNPRAPALPLVATHEVLYLPSVSDLAERRRAAARKPPRDPRKNGLAVLADPVADADDERWDGRRPPAAGISRARLEFSGREAEQIRAAAGARPTLLATGFAANRDLLLSGRLSDYRWLHIATHGLRDDKWPNLSSLLLSSYHADGRPRDGLVRSYEIRRLRLSAELVTLSACETASAPSLAAEGTFGLSRGFFEAGAESVLMTLWPVHDAATSELMSRFYRHLLAAGERPARALQLAQRSMAQDPRWSDPFFWAAFVLYGDWRAGAPAAKDTLTAEKPLFTTIR